MTIGLLLTFSFIAVPMAVLLVGPDDAILHRLMQRQRLRTWHYETLAVMALVATVVIVSGGSPVEWCGWAALVLAHGRNSILARRTPGPGAVRGHQIHADDGRGVHVASYQTGVADGMLIAAGPILLDMLLEQVAIHEACGGSESAAWEIKERLAKLGLVRLGVDRIGNESPKVELLDTDPDVAFPYGMGEAAMIVELDTAQLEHLGRRAGELGDGHVEHCCNMALAVRGAKLDNLTYNQILLSIIAEEPSYAEWMELGANTGYRRRQ